jgi:hypothetical protein
MFHSKQFMMGQLETIRMGLRLNHIEKMECLDVDWLSARTSKTKEEIKHAFEHEVWLSSDEAVKQGWADGIYGFTFETKERAVVSVDEAIEAIEMALAIPDEVPPSSKVEASDPADDVPF